MLTLYVNSKINPSTPGEMVKLELQTDEANDVLTVDNLMAAIKEKLVLNSLTDDYQLVCYGKKLKGENLLTDYGIKSNAVVNLFLKTEVEQNAPGTSGKKAKMDSFEIRNMIIASRTALMNQTFRQMLALLHEEEFRNNLIQCTAGLKDDPIAMAVLLDPELLNMVIDLGDMERVLLKHPVILEATTHLATAFHEERVKIGRNPSSSMSVDTSPAVSYSLDDLSDDEEMSGGVDAPPPNGQHIMPPQSAPSLAHWMQVFNYARPPQPNQSSAPSSSPMNTSAPTQHQTPTQPPVPRFVIGPDLLRHALQSTEPSTSQQRPNPASVATPNNPSGQSNSVAPSRSDMSQQIAQMRELGLTDESVCLNALYATGGDVVAALELIFSDRGPNPQ